MFNYVPMPFPPKKSRTTESTESSSTESSSTESSTTEENSHEEVKVPDRDDSEDRKRREEEERRRKELEDEIAQLKEKANEPKEKPVKFEWDIMKPVGLKVKVIQMK